MGQIFDVVAGYSEADQAAAQVVEFQLERRETGMLDMVSATLLSLGRRLAIARHQA
ncbi:MAG: hypothetical protein ABSB49_03145 [Polyangia bacterium]